MAQKQCPNCGGYKVSITTNYIRKVSTTLTQKITSLLFLEIPIVIVVLIVQGDLWLGVILNLILIPIILFTKRREITGYEFTCDLCGYKWDWRIGDPWPSVKVQPNLIAAGAKQLEQQKAAIPCKGCGNTIPEGYPYCPYCGTSR